MIDLQAALMEAGIGVVDRWAAKALVEARRRAPVRKVFQGQGSFERIRAKTAEEIEADRDLRVRLGLGPEFEPLNRAGARPATILTRFAPQELGSRAVTPGVDRFTGRRIPRRMETLESQQRLDRRGRYELASGRAITGRSNLGGRLRDEIRVEPAVVEGRRITARLVSPTPYAKFQELGTRHNPAHPYLRPAGYHTAEAARLDAQRSVAATLREGFRATVPVKGSMRVG